jgi:hypothetical protein
LVPWRSVTCWYPRNLQHSTRHWLQFGLYVLVALNFSSLS